MIRQRKWKYPPDRNGERWCSRCRTFKPIECFGLNSVRAGGGHRRVCRSCQRAYGTQWWRNNRQGKPRGWRKTAGRM